MKKKLYSDGSTRNLILDFNIPLNNGVKITEENGDSVSFIIAGRNKIRFTKEIPTGFVYLETYEEKPKMAIKKIDLSNIGFSVIRQDDIDYLNRILDVAVSKSEELDKRSIETERLSEIIRSLETENKKKIDENWTSIQNSLKSLYDKITDSYNSGSKNIESVRSYLSSVIETIKNEIEYHLKENNPHDITKKDVGLDMVDNTSDLEKPISNSVKNALDEKLDKKELSKIKDELKKSDKKIEKIYKGLSNMGGGIAQDLSGFVTKDYVDEKDAQKLDKNNPITAGTHTKITYDTKGLVTGGSNLTASDIPDLSATYYLASNPSGYTSNTGTVTSVAVSMNGSTKGTVTTSGTIDLGTVITAHQDISGKENTSNKVTSISSSSTNTQYPSAKCVYDIVGNIEATLQAIRGV